MGGTLELWLTDDRGFRLASLASTLGTTASKATDTIGWITYQCPPSFDRSLYRPDRMIQVWYQPDGGARGLWNVYFLRRRTIETDGSRKVMLWEGPDLKGLLFRRIVAAKSGSSEASKTGFADDVMKEIVAESLLDTADPTPDSGTRAWANLSIQADLSQGPTLTKSFSFDKLLTLDGGGVLPAWQKASRADGLEIFYDVRPNIVTPSSINFQFQTFPGFPGRNLSDKTVFDEGTGNMKNAKLVEDHSEAYNYVYAAGQGEGAARVVRQAYDVTSYGLSIWGRIEHFADARNQDDPDGVLAVAAASLVEGLPKIRFTATPVDTEQTRFYKDWDVGDVVTTKYETIQFDSIIRAAALSVSSDSRVEVDARLDFAT